MTYENWLEQIEMRGLKPERIDRITLAVAYKKGWTPAQFVEHETGKNSDENNNKEWKSVDPNTSTNLLSRILPVYRVLMYVVAAGTTGYVRQLLSDNISTYNGQPPKDLVGAEDAVIRVKYIQSLWLFFSTICFIFVGTMILLLSKSIR